MKYHYATHNTPANTPATRPPTQAFAARAMRGADADAAPNTAKRGGSAASFIRTKI